MIPPDAKESMDKNKIGLKGNLIDLSICFFCFVFFKAKLNSRTVLGNGVYIGNMY